MQGNPTISVITLVFNTGEYVVQALESLRRQTIFEKTGSIIIDDCSSDNSVEIVENWISKNNFECVFIKNSKNCGIPKNLNRALKLVKGKYYTLLGDDLWIPTYLESQLNSIEKEDDQTALIFSDVNEIDSKNNSISEEFLRMKGFKEIPEGYIFNTMLQKSCIPAISALIKVEIVRELGGYDENLIAEDYDMWLRITKNYKVKFNPNTHVLYRRHGASFSFKFPKGLLLNRLEVFNKHYGYNSTHDEIIKKNVSGFILSLYFQDQSAITMNWFGRLISPSYSFCSGLIYYLIKLKFPSKLIKFIYKYNCNK